MNSGTGKKLFCKLKQLMGARQIDQISLANAIGINVNTINRLYNNNFQRIDIHTIELIATYLDCELTDLFEFR